MTYFQINSIVKAFKLLELLATKNEFQLAEVCQLLKLPKTTIHRMLLTLESLGYVQQNPKNLGYMASIKLFELGGKVIQNLDLIQIAKPLMIELYEKTGETVNLGVLENCDVVCIDKVDSKRYLRIDQPIGTRAKAYHAAMGKAILAYLPEEERKQLLSESAISSATPKSLKTTSAIEKDLQGVRERGYSIDDEEYSMGVRCVGAPIFDHNSKVLAGLSIAGPALRITEKDIGSLAKLVTWTATSISNNL
jgi:DNA-binding IclR family transcriptional regulator